MRVYCFNQDLQKTRNALSQQLNGILKEKRIAAHDDSLSVQADGLKDSIAQLNEEKSTLKQKITSIDDEIEHFASQIESLESEIEKTSEPLKDLDVKISQTQKIIHMAQNEICADFCKEIKVKNIREYQQGTLSLVSESTRKKMEYVTAKSKLENTYQLTYAG